MPQTIVAKFQKTIFWAGEMTRTGLSKGVEGSETRQFST